MYTCKQIRDIVKSRLNHEHRKECIQDADYFDFIKRGIVRLHRILVTVNSSYYKTAKEDYTMSIYTDRITALPDDCYKVLNFHTSEAEWPLHWDVMEVDSDADRGLTSPIPTKKSGVHTSEDDDANDRTGQLIYIREPDLPTDWAGTPDLPELWSDWLLQYVLAESMAIASNNPQNELHRLAELDDIARAQIRGGGAGQTAVS